MGIKDFTHIMHITDADIERIARDNASRGKPLNPLLDSVFKAVFSGGSEDSQRALKSLLSACTGRAVSGVQIMNSELIPAYLAGKTLRLDVHATFNDGEAADLEMQMHKPR
jgi:hypothetical protein